MVLSKTFRAPRKRCLKRWMHRLLRFAGGWNLVAGAGMIFCYHEIYQMIDPAKPELTLPIQLVGMMVMLFGVGYILVDRDPVGNRNVLFLGMLSKAIGPFLAAFYIAKGILPWQMIPLLVVADLIYLWPFYRILRLIDRKKIEIENC